MSAVRLARAATGRNAIVKFDGCYHGHADPLLAAAGSGVATLGLPDSPGVTAATVADTLIAPFNDLARGGGDLRREGRRHRRGARRAGSRQHGRRAASRRASSRASAALTRRAGALLVFDEVMTGWRVHPRGRPDPVRDRARPHLPRQGGRGRAAGGGLRWPARSHGADRAGGPGLSGGHPLGESARHGRRPGDARRAFAGRRLGSRRAVGAPGRGGDIPSRGRGRRTGHRTAGRHHAYALLHRRAGSGLCRRPGAPTAPPTTPSSTRCSRPASTSRHRRSRRRSPLRCTGRRSSSSCGMRSRRHGSGSSRRSRHRRTDRRLPPQAAGDSGRRLRERGTRTAVPSAPRGARAISRRWARTHSPSPSSQLRAILGELDLESRAPAGLARRPEPIHRAARQARPAPHQPPRAAHHPSPFQ